jgi:hypothetical protein
LQKLFSHTFSDHIWRMLPHPTQNLWVVELRKINEKKVGFGLIDLDKSELRWNVMPIELDWWSSMTGFSGEQIFFHFYRYPEIPEPTDLAAFSVVDGRFLWILPNHILVRTLQDGLIEVATKTMSGTVFKICDGSTGAILSEASSFEAIGDAGIKSPFRYTKENAYFEKLSQYLNQILEISDPICIDYLDHKPFMVFSYYLYDHDKVIQYLAIVTENSEVVLHEQLTEGRSGIGDSSILLKESNLIYLTNSNQFSSLKLSV